LIGRVNLKKIKLSSAILLSISAIIITFVGVITYGFARDDSFASPFEKFGHNDYENFGELGNQLFHLYNEGYLKMGDTLGFNEYDAKNPKVENVLSKYKGKIACIYIVDKDVILLSFGAIFQSVDGIAIRRNNAELKNTYEGTGFEAMHYTELITNVFHFTAGL
jgi:hypothetical protein